MWFFCVSFNILTALARWRICAEHALAMRITYYVLCYGVSLIPMIVVLIRKKFVGGTLICGIDGAIANGWYAHILTLLEHQYGASDTDTAS